MFRSLPPPRCFAFLFTSDADLRTLLDRVVNHAETEKGKYRPLHALAVGGQGDIRFDKAQRPVAVSEKYLAQFRRKFVIDKSPPARRYDLNQCCSAQTASRLT